MVRFGVGLALGAAAAAGCGDGENTDPNGAGTAGSGGAGAVGGMESDSGGGGGTTEAGSGGASPLAGRSGAGESGQGQGGSTSGRGGMSAGGKEQSAGDTSAPGGAGSGGTRDVTPPPTAPTCDDAKGKLPKLVLTAFADVDDPVQAVAPPADPRLFVLSRGGRISVVKDGEVLEDAFLELEVDTHYAELGLLGLAFHPNYAENGLFYVHHIAERIDDQDTGDLLVEEYEVDPDDANRALPTPRRELIRIPQPSHKHKAGTMTFDSQGLLYIAIGNGGEQPASHDNTQLRGKVLRIMPEPDEDTYGIPATNPQPNGWSPEILDTGLRNPWRIALDPCNDDLYIGDVGNATNEEIDVLRAGDHGHDFGFPAFEGSERTCDGCEVSGDELPPTVEYGHGEGCAVIGGVVYRGHAIPALRGRYIYSDLCAGMFRTFRFDGSSVEDELDLTDDLNPSGINQISSFGTDMSGEIYVTSLSKNRVYRIDPE